MKQQLITYGPGGFKPDRADKNITDEREVDVPDELPSIDEQVQSLKTATRVATVRQVRDGVLSDAEVAALAPVYDLWEPGIEVAVGDVYQWDGTLVECIQGHTTQADWTPDVTPALWKIHRTDSGGGPIAWQPGISVEVDEQVTYEGTTYTVLQAHTTQSGWEPPSAPALFEAV